MTSASPEEVGCLIGGPARAAEVALARLLDVDLIRVSGDGLMTARDRPGFGAMTPLQLHVLNDVRAGGRHLHEVVGDAAESPLATELHARLIERGLLRGEGDRTKAGREAVTLAEPSARHDRVVAVAFHGLRGRVGVFSVARLFGLTPEIVRTLPEHHRDA
ncbi:TIGR04222 domain-containing membrane protein [Lentzea sp. NPDC004782]|uniref:TIGR04222 domain-containing membrane protein n=1 Tax=Lentzea sp. NPDC004782 TaxID=3154458 RepID=UPI0033AB3BF6